MIKILDADQVPLSEILARPEEKRDISGAVANIIEDVRQNGDAALRRYTKEFDKAEPDTLEVSQEQIDAFKENCGKKFGENAVLNPANLIEAGKFEVKTSQVTVSVRPEQSYLVETRTIDGKKYLLIPAEEDVEVNGQAVRFESAASVSE